VLLLQRGLNVHLGGRKKCTAGDFLRGTGNLDIDGVERRYSAEFGIATQRLARCHELERSILMLEPSAS